MTLHVTVNLAKENGYDAVLHDLRKIGAQMSGQPTVIHCQEVETWGHVRALELFAAEAGLIIAWAGGTPRRGRKPGWKNYCPVLFTAAHHTLVSVAGRRTIGGIFLRWPTEGLTKAVLDLHDGGGSVVRRYAAMSVHMIPQAFTSHRERQGKWRRQMRRVARITRNAGMPVVGGSDFNRDRAQVPGARRLFTKGGTHGRAHYDGFWLTGPARTVHHKYDLELRSDHDAALAVFAD